MTGYITNVCREYYGSRGETPKLKLGEKENSRNISQVVTFKLSLKE